MRSIAFADFFIGVGILFVLEGLLFASSPAWMRRAMKSAVATPDNILRAVGIGSAVAGLILICAWPRRHRRRGGEGDRRSGQHLDVADRRGQGRRQGRGAATAAGFAV